MMENRRALTPAELQQIEKDFAGSAVTDYEIFKLVETIKIQRDCLEFFLSLFQRDPLRLVSIADPVRVVTLDEIALRCALVGVRPPDNRK